MPSPVAIAATPAATAVAVGSAERLQRAIERVLPAVVTVIADGVPRRNEQGNVTQQRNVGSGIVIDERGHIVTNFHVIDGAVEINVLLATGERRPAVIRSHDSPYSDLAVLSISPEGLRSASLGDSSRLVPGEPVAAISAAGFAVGNSVSVGIVSATGRDWPRNGAILEDLVQTDAAVNSGDSGGALINSDGEVIGILTTVVRGTNTGSPVQGISFAQSSNSLRPIIEDIVLLGSYVRPRLGIERPFRQPHRAHAGVRCIAGRPASRRRARDRGRGGERGGAGGHPHRGYRDGGERRRGRPRPSLCESAEAAASG